MSISIPGKPGGWALEKTGHRMMLKESTRQFEEAIRRAARKTISIISSDNNEFEIIVSTFQLEPRPDVDHIATSIMNALKKIVYADDRQVSSLCIHRFSCDNCDNEERTEISVYRLENHARAS